MPSKTKKTSTPKPAKGLSKEAGGLREGTAALNAQLQEAITTYAAKKVDQPGFHNAVTHLNEAERFLRKAENQLAEAEAAAAPKGGA